jgi:hypothetical protein
MSLLYIYLPPFVVVEHCTEPFTMLSTFSLPQRDATQGNSSPNVGAIDVE